MKNHFVTLLLVFSFFFGYAQENPQKLAAQYTKDLTEAVELDKRQEKAIYELLRNSYQKKEDFKNEKETENYNRRIALEFENRLNAILTQIQRHKLKEEAKNVHDRILQSFSIKEGKRSNKKERKN